jgi:hypothetical protein
MDCEIHMSADLGGSLGFVQELERRLQKTERIRQQILLTAGFASHCCPPPWLLACLCHANGKS